MTDLSGSDLCSAPALLSCRSQVTNLVSALRSSRHRIKQSSTVCHSTSHHEESADQTRTHAVLVLHERVVCWHGGSSQRFLAYLLDEVVEDPSHDLLEGPVVGLDQAVAVSVQDVLGHGVQALHDVHHAVTQRLQEGLEGRAGL